MHTSLRNFAIIIASLLAVLSNGESLAQTYPSKPIRLVVPFARGGKPGSRRGFWRWGGDGLRPPGLWHGILQRFATVTFAVASIVAFPAVAQNYPSKPIRLVVPFAPGGGTDIMARVFAQKFSDATGQSVVVDNRAGGGGTIGAETTVRSTPDGYTLCMVSTSYSTNAALFRLQYDPVKDITPIVLIGDAGILLTLHPSVPAHTVKELIALAKAKPDSINFASTGPGGNTHMATELFIMMAGIRMTHVPYRAPAPR